MNLHTIQTTLPSTPQCLARDTLQLRIAEGSLATAFRRLAFLEYASRSWVDVTQYPDGILTDEFDAVSDALVIVDQDECVAGTRVVRHSHLGFPHEKELRLDYLTPGILGSERTYSLLTTTPRREWAEVTRVVGKRRVKKLTLDIIKCLYWYAERSGISLYVMVIDLNFFTLCTEHNGIPITPIGVPVYCEGSWTIPAVTEPHRWPEVISDANPAGWNHISNTAGLDLTWSRH